MLAQLFHHRCSGGYEQENCAKARALVNMGLIQTEETAIRRKDGFVYNGSLLYTLKPIQQVMREREKEFLAELKLVGAQRKWDWCDQERNRHRSAL